MLDLFGKDGRYNLIAEHWPKGMIMWHSSNQKQQPFATLSKVSENYIKYTHGYL